MSRPILSSLTSNNILASFTRPGQNNPLTSVLYQSIYSPAFKHNVHPNQYLATYQVPKNKSFDRIRLLNTQSASYKQYKFTHTQNLRKVKSDMICTRLPEKFRNEWPKITLFGDSITRFSFDVNNGCWGSMIAFHVNSFMHVDPFGFSGYNTRLALEMMPKMFPRSYLERVEVFTLFFGHNDAWASNTPLHVPIEQYEQNMRNIVSYLLNNGLKKEALILITPGWYHKENFDKWSRENMKLIIVSKEMEESKKYVDAVVKISNELDISLVDFWTIGLHHKPYAELFCDGLHLSKIGAKLLYDQLMPLIEKKLHKSFGKPLGQLYHVLPYDQLPEYKEAVSNASLELK